MPRTKSETERVNIRIPKAIVDAVDKIVEKAPEFYVNRQKFIEASIVEKIERIRAIIAREAAQPVA